MSIEIKYIPLSFINTDEEVLKQIKNTVLFSYLFQKFDKTSLSHYLESTQYGYTASASETGTHQLVRITDINSGKVNWNTVPFCDCDVEDKYLLKDDDILVARTGGTTGKSFIVNSAPNNAVFASYLIRLRLKKEVNLEFINLYLNSYTFWSQIVEMKSGSAMPNVNAEKLKTLRIPKVSFKEQNEFVTAFKNVEKGKNLNFVFDKINEVESLFINSKKIVNELTQQLDLIKQLRQAFLREAMQGKLLAKAEIGKSNNPPAKAGGDLTGHDLLKKIKEDKINRNAALARSKKEKELPPITDDEIPFEIPKHWAWCRLGDTGNLKRGKSKHRPRNDEELFVGGTIPFIQTGDVSKAKYNNDLITTINGYYNDFGLKQSELQKKGTLCITIAANIAECGFLDFDACLPDSIVCYLAIDKIIEKYVYYYLIVAKDELERFAPATAQKNINLGILNDLKIPFPPLHEQEQIVAKLEELMAFCDGLEQSIKESQGYNEMLLHQVLREALQTNKKIYGKY